MKEFQDVVATAALCWLIEKDNPVVPTSIGNS
jgi:hypothetical protein